MKKDKKEVVELTGAEKLAVRTENFFAKNWKLISCICIVIAIAIIIIGAISYMNVSKQNKEFNAITRLEQSYISIASMDNQSEDFKKALADLNSEADSIMASAGGYPALKAKYLKGLAALFAEDWASAADIFNAVAVDAKGSYLAPVALVNAAVAEENNGNQDKALENYNKVWNDYGKDCPEAAKALFNVARIYEAKGDKELAKATYSQLVDAFLGTTGSEYARIAQARLIAL